MDYKTLNAMGYGFLPEAVVMVQEAFDASREAFLRVDNTALYNEGKVLSAFASCGVMASHLFGSTGYGYGDVARDTLCLLYTSCCGGIERAVKQALMASGKFLPWQVVTVTTDGRILE